jgi:16S rRNA (cytidine1402-2'-O)-methyltransferase
MGKLFIIPTPIGNLEDITLRALKILNETDLILAEDTRTSSILLNHYQVKSKVTSYHKFNEHSSLQTVINKLKSNLNICLISDAGTPSISDPGFLLVRECLENGIEVECLPGATAFLPALVKSGIPSDRFCFEGFLPQKKGRQTRLLELSEEPRTMIFYESPFRLIKTLEQFSEYFGNQRKASVSRELTKVYEETINGTIEELINYYKENTLKGEIVIIVEGKSKQKNKGKRSHNENL